MPASRDRGIAVSEIAAALRFDRNTNSTIATSTAPRSSDLVMFRSARSMNSEGRKRAGCSDEACRRYGGGKLVKRLLGARGDDLGIGAELGRHHDHERPARH